jgi:hypothetical protein
MRESPGDGSLFSHSQMTQTCHSSLAVVRLLFRTKSNLMYYYETVGVSADTFDKTQFQADQQAYNEQISH